MANANTTPRQNWSTDETVKMMEALEGYPILYDPSNKEFMRTSNCKNRTDAFNELSAAIGRTSDEIATKVKSIKGQYMREKSKKAGKSGDGAKNGKEWFGLKIMSSYMDGTAGFVRKSTSSLAVVSISQLFL